MSIIRVARTCALAVIGCTGVLAFGAGCDSVSGSSSGSAPMVKDNPPAPGELSTEDVLKQQAEAKKKR
jgi:hypothetical protein